MVNKIRVDSIPATASKGLPGICLRRTTVFSTTTARICVLIQVSVFIVFALPVGLLSAPFPSVLKMSKIIWWREQDSNLHEHLHMVLSV